MTDVDVVVIGAGFAGIYMSYQLEQNGFTVKGYERAPGVGGVWYQSRYPGAKCDSESIYYSFTFSEELFKKWTWSERYASQDEILRYLNFVADELDIKKHFEFNMEVKQVKWDTENNVWVVTTNDGKQTVAKYVISAVGCLSTSNIPKIPGQELFKGASYHTGHWPEEGVALEGKKIGVIGNGSSGIQTIPQVAKVAERVYAFQRTPQYTNPAHNRPLKEEEVTALKNNYSEIRKAMHNSFSGLPLEMPNRSALEDSEEVREAKFEEAWQTGGMAMSFTYSDLVVNPEANEFVSQFIKKKIVETVKDPKTAQRLMPNYYYGTKRPIVNINYYESFNLPNVELVTLRDEPIVAITEKGIQTAEREIELDMIIYATGYDAMTGTLLKIDIIGKDGKSLKEQWNNGADTESYLGLGISNLPNFLTITGPFSPSVFTNVPVAIEQHVDWITDLLLHMKEQNYGLVEVNKEAEQQWSALCTDIANNTLYTQTPSWYTGSNVDGKSDKFLMYVAGLSNYRDYCNQVKANNFEGFTFKKESVNQA